MKAVIILALLAVGGWYGWKYVSTPAVEDDSSIDAAPVAEAAAPRTTPEWGEASDGPRRSAPTTSSATKPKPARNGSAALPADLQTLREATDRKWQTIVAAGSNPVTAGEAITMAKDYSRVLRGMYAVAGSEAQQETLIAERLRPLAQAIFFSPAPYLDDTTGFVINYTVQPGDILDRIGRAHGMSFQFINMIRGRQPDNATLHPGDRLKLFDLKERGYQLYVSKSEFQMDLFIGGIFARRYDIGIGEDITPTPAGTTHITAREKYPQWTDPRTNQVFEYGAEGHILGPVWLAFDPVIGRNGLGIHGYTGDGHATGVRASNGCIRMRNEEALDLYNILVPVSSSANGLHSRAPMTVTIVE